jgi:hypothetical protein
MQFLRVPVNLLGDNRCAVPDEVGDLLDGDSVVTHDGHERVPKLPWGPSSAYIGAWFDAMPAKVRSALTLYHSALKAENVEIRLHDTVLYSSLYRADDQLLVNQHAYGIPATHAPVFCFRESNDGDLLTAYLDSFERVWNASKQALLHLQLAVATISSSTTSVMISPEISTMFSPPLGEGPREPGAGTDVIRRPVTHRDPLRAFALVRGSPFDSNRLYRTYGTCMACRRSGSESSLAPPDHRIIKSFEEVSDRAVTIRHLNAVKPAIRHASQPGRSGINLAAHPA